MAGATKTKHGFSPIYLAVLSGVVLSILIVNGVLEMNRTRRGFFLLLEREATFLILHYERNIKDALENLEQTEGSLEGRSVNWSLSEFLFALEESIGEYLMNVSLALDRLDERGTLSASDLTSLGEQYLLSSIGFYDLEGNWIKGWPASPPSPGDRRLLGNLFEKKRSVIIDLSGDVLGERGEAVAAAVSRRIGKGVIVIRTHGEKRKSLFRRLALQRAISDIELKQDILYVSLLDGNLNTLAQVEAAPVEGTAEDSFLRQSLSKETISSRIYRDRTGEEVFEVVKAFSFGERSKGLIRVGYSPREILPVLGQIRKNVIVSIIFSILLGVSAVTLIWSNQNRHLRRLREMEDRVRLAERLSSLGQLAAGVAHEVRNPLNAIGMGLQRLKREFAPQEDRSKQQYLSFIELILREIQRVNGIVEQFLSLSRPFQLDRKPCSIGKMLEDLVALFREEASARGIDLKQEIDPALPSISVDEPKLTQAIVNIMKNAMEAMEKGGELRISAERQKDVIRIMVSDTGPGIDPDRMEKIFDYYYTTKEKGAGLGLPIAHRIVEAHGGSLEVSSQEGTGTRVTITLPLS